MGTEKINKLETRAGCLEAARTLGDIPSLLNTIAEAFTWTIENVPLTKEQREETHLDQLVKALRDPENPLNKKLGEIRDELLLRAGGFRDI